MGAGLYGLAPLVDFGNVEAEALVEGRIRHEAYDAMRTSAVDNALTAELAHEPSSFDSGRRRS